MKIAVVGSGLSGLACALKLLENGFEVHVFEKEKDFGGLAGSITLGNYRFPKTYHHVLKSDKYLNEALKRFKIAVSWRNLNIGLYADSKIFPFNDALDLLRFSYLSTLDRLRLGWLVLNAKHDESLSNITIKEWVTAKAGARVYKTIINPLISTYFGSSEDIAAIYLARRWSDESKYASNNLGYADFPKFVDRYVDEIVSKNGIFKINCAVKAIKVKDKVVRILSRGEEYYDAVVLTCPTLESILLLRGISREAISPLNAVQYRACLCLAMSLEEKISDYYWINILDNEIPFIACFEHGNLNPSLKGGLLYTVRYVTDTDPLWNMNANTIYERFKANLKKIFKSLPKVKSWTLFKARYGTPVYKVGYKNMRINPYPRLYFAGIYMAFPEMRSSGPAIRTGIQVAEKITQDF